EADDAGQMRRAERLRRGQEVDRLDEVRLPVAVAADDEVGGRMELHFLRGEVSEVLCCEASKDHVECAGHAGALTAAAWPPHSRITPVASASQRTNTHTEDPRSGRRGGRCTASSRPSA